MKPLWINLGEMKLKKPKQYDEAPLKLFQEGSVRTWKDLSSKAKAMDEGQAAQTFSTIKNTNSTRGSTTCYYFLHNL